MSKLDKCICIFLLHALGDTIGFKNATWEFNYKNDDEDETLDVVSEFIYEFIDLGGVNGIDLKDWIISDDTLYHMAIGKSMLNYNGKVDDEFILNVKNNLIEMHNRMDIEEKTSGIFRFPGKTTSKYIQKFTETQDARHYKYDPMTGGNGAALRSLCIGIALYKEEQIDELIDVSIQTGKMTHNSPTGFLAGFTIAYFISLAMRNINIIKWPFMMLELLESDKIKKYINMTNNGEMFDYVEYIRYWRRYIDTRFVNEKPVKLRSTSNMMFRVRYYFDNFVRDTKATIIGGSGYCAVIMAYDAVLDCDGKWEKLIFYAILHPGDSDTTGAIAGGMYGALYGYGDVPKNMMCCIEEKDTIIDIANKMYQKIK